MSSKPKYLFAVYEGDKRVFDGSSADVAAWLGMFDVQMLYTYVYKNLKWQRKYNIVKTFEEARPTTTTVYFKPKKRYKKKLPKERNYIFPKDKEESHLLYLISMLTKYNETFSWSNGDQFRKGLSKAGIAIRSRRCMDGKGYILERCDK